MNVVAPYVEILDTLDGAQILKKIELAGRVCYKRAPRKNLSRTC